MILRAFASTLHRSPSLRQAAARLRVSPPERLRQRQFLYAGEPVHRTGSPHYVRLMRQLNSYMDSATSEKTAKNITNIGTMDKVHTWYINREFRKFRNRQKPLSTRENCF